MSVKVLLKKIKMLESVLGVEEEPRYTIAEDVWRTIPEDERRKLTDSASLLWKRSNMERRGEFVPELTDREIQLCQDAQRIFDKYKELESDVRKRTPPIH